MNVNWKKYLNPKNKEMLNLFSRNDFDIIHQIYIRLRKAYQQNKSHTILIEFENSDIVSIVNRDEYLSAFKKLFEVCLAIEYYEICSDLNFIILQKVSSDRVTKTRGFVM